MSWGVMVMGVERVPCFNMANLVYKGVTTMIYRINES